MLGEFDELPPSDQFPVATGEHPLHFCGIKEEFRLDGKLYPIPELVWTWWFHGSIPGWANDKTEAVIQKAISTWSKVCRLRFKQASTRDSANVLITTERIDGNQGILADAQLYTGQRQQKLRFDLEKYVDTLRPGPGYIGFPHVTAHEWGHIIAFPHLAYDGTPDLMNPTYNPDIHEPQADEASIALKLFGAPDATPPATPAPPPTAADELRFGFKVGDVQADLTVLPRSSSCGVKIEVQQGEKKQTFSGSKPW